MDIALEQALRRDYPALYGHYRENHFWCEDGWYPLLRALSQKLEIYAQEHGIRIYVHEVKQKFGTMRYYYGYDGVLPDRQKHALFQIVEEYENRSRRICEHCGLPGTLLVRDGYWYVAFPEHAKGGLTPAAFQKLQESPSPAKGGAPKGSSTAGRLPGTIT